MGMLLNAILLAVIAALYAVLPLSIDPVAVEWARNPSTSGPFQPNDAFKKVKLIGKGKIFGPETVVFNKEGELFGFTEFGSVVQIFEEEDRVVEWAHIGGRPISGVFDQNGDLIVCDVTKGLLKVNKNTKEVSLLTARTDDGIPLTFIDDVDIGPDGKIYFSDATVFSPQRKRDGTYNLMDTSVLELLEGQKTGRLVEYDPVSKTTTTLMSGLYFANGIAVSQKGDYVLINETLAKRTHRYWLQGPKKGTHELFMDTVPGFVDGISRRPNGNYWVAVPKIESDPTLQFIASRPWLKAFLAKVLLPVILSVQKHVAIIYEVSPEGEVLGGLFDMKGEMIHGITSVTEHNGKLYLGSFNDFLGVYDLSS